jgi:hypothetical protein
MRGVRKLDEREPTLMRALLSRPSKILSRSLSSSLEVASTIFSQKLLHNQ